MSRIMDEADILAGRAKSVSARHYALYELDRLTDTYIQCWERLGVSNKVGIKLCGATRKYADERLASVVDFLRRMTRMLTSASCVSLI